MSTMNHDVAGGDAISAEDGVLDALLASWAEQHAPAPEQFDEIRRAVLSEAEAAGDLGVFEAMLPAGWWRAFFDDLQVSLRRAANLETVLAVTASSAA